MNNMKKPIMDILKGRKDFVLSLMAATVIVLVTGVFLLTEVVGSEGENANLEIENENLSVLTKSEPVRSSENEETKKAVELLLNEIISNSPKTSSNPYDYIKDNSDFNKLVTVGKPAMDAMLDIFSQGNEDGLKEYIMACACARIMGIFNEQKGLGTSSGREWFYKYGQFEKNRDFQTVDADFDIFPKDPVNRKSVLLPEDTDKKNLEEVLSNYILAKNRNAYLIGEKAIEAHEIYRTEEKEGILNVYLLVRFGWFGFKNNTFTMVSGGGGVPVRMQFKKSGDGIYEVLEYRRAMDGGMYGESIREMFPEDLAELVITGDDKTKKKLEDIQKMKAENYLAEIQRQDSPIDFHMVKEKPEADARKAIYLVTLMRKEFPDWNGTREILVRTGGKAPGMKIRCVLQTQCDKEKYGQYTVTLTKTWDIKINGIQPVSYWKYRVTGKRVELVDEQDNDHGIKIIK